MEIVAEQELNPEQGDRASHFGGQDTSVLPISKLFSIQGTWIPASPSCQPSWGEGPSGCWGARRRPRW